MNSKKSKIRTWLESRITGILTMPQWRILREKYSNQQLRAMTRERIRSILSSRGE